MKAAKPKEKMERQVFCVLVVRLVVPMLLAALPFWEEACYVFGGGVFKAELLVAEVLADCRKLVRVMRLMCIVPSTSLTPLLLQSSILFRRRLKSVADVLKGIRQYGFTQARICRGSGLLCVVIVLVVLFLPWDGWIPPDLRGFCKWNFDSLDIFDDFTRRVVVCRKDAGLRKWASWLREDLGFRPNAWLRPDFVLPFSFLSLRTLRLRCLGFWWNLVSLMLSFVKPGCLFFCRSGHPVVSVDQFLHFVGHILLQEATLELPRISGRELQEVALAKKSTAAGLDGWAWNEVKALPLSWFSGFTFLLELVETTGVWPRGLLDAKIAMIPKADGVSTPFGQRPLSVLPVICRL